VSRIRVAALLSAVIASIVAFLILKRWGLVGTLTGAALFPFVHTLVSHWSHKGIDQTISVVRRRSGDGLSAPEEGEPPSPDQLDVSGPAKKPRATPASTRWLSVGLACVALGIGVYAILLGTSGERVIVRERVIEREVAAAVQSTKASDEPDAPGPATDPTTTTSTSLTTSTTDEDTPGLDSSSTTATGPVDTVDGPDGTTPQSAEGGNVATDTTTGITGVSRTTSTPVQTAP
jgi:hypothetical protein